jgi:hypothetical protein
MDKKTLLGNKSTKLKFTKYFKEELDKLNIPIEEELGSRITLEFIYDVKKPSSAIAKKYKEFKNKYSSEITTIMATFCRDVLKEGLDGIVLPEPSTNTKKSKKTGKKTKSKIESTPSFEENITDSIAEKTARINHAKVSVNGDSIIFTTDKKISDYLYSSISILTTLNLATISMINPKDTKNVSYLVKWEKDVDERTRQLISNRIKDRIERDISVKVKINVFA